MRRRRALPSLALLALFSLPLAPSARAQTAPSSAPAPAPTAPLPAEPDGNDEPAPHAGPGLAGAHGTFTRVGRAPLSHPHICDLTPFADALYIAYARRPLGSDGATLARYRPDPANPRAQPFTVAFDWNRRGQPAQGGGAGQGFLRARVLGDVLAVPDADPPYAGFGFVYAGTEGYVFLSDHEGHFAPARGPRLIAPAVPSPDGTRPGASVIPRAYHVLDVISYRGHWYASTGSVPPGGRAWYGNAPGALHLANASRSRFEFAVEYPHPGTPEVYRLTYLVRFRGRLYAGIQDYFGRGPHDYVFFDPPAGVTTLTQAHAHTGRVTASGAALTLRWFTDAGRLFWIALERSGATLLRVTDDGTTWTTIALPPELGRPTDLARYRGALVLLTEGGLARLDGAGTNLTAVPIAPAPRSEGRRARSHFALDDAFCAAPLAVYRDGLYAGSQVDGGLYRVEF